MTKLQTYLKTHSLIELKNEFAIEYKFHPNYSNLVQFSYSIDSPMNNSIVQESRGIILDKDTLEIVSIAFDKFFNVEETNAVKINWDNAVVQEKLDGSCLTIYYYDSKWQVMTNGSSNAGGNVDDNPFTFEEYFWKTFKDQGLNFPKDTSLCYSFELTGPYNQIIVHHTEPKLTLIGVRSKDTTELDPKLYSTEINCKVVKTYAYNKLQDLIDSFETTSPLDSEGYVVMDGFKRVKIKNPKYVLWHHLKGKLTNKGILQTILMGEKDEFIAYFPQKAEVFNDIETKLKFYIKRIEEDYNTIKDVENIKEFASYAVLKDNNSAMFAVKRRKSPSIKNYIENTQIDRLLEQLKLK